MFSPRAWGWSDEHEPAACSRCQFSPRAWGWSEAPAQISGADGSPHARGDGPRSAVASAWPAMVLPTCVGMVRPKSCLARARAGVLPTCVGMVRHVAACDRDRGRVLPTCVGMVRFSTDRRGRRRSFSPRAWGWSGPAASSPTVTRCSPHVRGDGPVLAQAFTLRLDVLPTCVGMVRLHPMRQRARATFSPRAWGWSVAWTEDRLAVSVLPTCVGMVRFSTSWNSDSAGSPHVRGDGPHATLDGQGAACRSPHVRGDGPIPPLRPVDLGGVLPTCVGMVRARATLPSACGPVLPTCVGMVRIARRIGVRRHRVLPTCVGMVRRGRRGSQGSTAAFSPRAWGWSVLRRSPDRGDAVLPTCVGMVRNVSHRQSRRLRFSPRAWGWSVLSRRFGLGGRVLPTCVGMVRSPGQSP